MTVCVDTQRNAESELLAAHLYGGLEKRGFSVWLDVKMPARDEKAMEEGVKNSRCVIAIVSGAAEGQSEMAYFHREFCLKELRWAMDAEVFVQPVVAAADKKEISEMMQQVPADLEHLKGINWEHIDHKDNEYFALGVDKIIRSAKLNDPAVRSQDRDRVVARAGVNALHKAAGHPQQGSVSINEVELRSLCRTQPELCLGADEHGDLPLHIALRQPSLTRETAEVLIKAKSEALQVKDRAGENAEQGLNRNKDNYTQPGVYEYAMLLINANDDSYCDEATRIQKQEGERKSATEKLRQELEKETRRLRRMTADAERLQKQADAGCGCCSSQSKDRSSTVERLRERSHQAQEKVRILTDAYDFFDDLDVKALAANR